MDTTTHDDDISVEQVSLEMASDDTSPWRPGKTVHIDRPGRIRRLSEELEEEGFTFRGGTPGWRDLLLGELDYALHPSVHERRIPSYGAIIEPTVDPSLWSEPTELHFTRRAVKGFPLSDARRFADGLSSWLLRRTDGTKDSVVFDRAAGSERDLVVLAEALGATLVQRHPSGSVRVVGDFGVLRWDGIGWHHEAPVQAWIDAFTVCAHHGDREILTMLLEFAVHDLGARGIGALLVYRPNDDVMPNYEIRLAEPPPLRIDRPSDLAPFRHVLAQIDGAAVFDARGTLRQLGVRLVPSLEAEAEVAGFRGMRHTAGRRYSFDDELATVIVVSEDGPVTVLRNGKILGRSTRDASDLVNLTPFE
ncbi:hypothetical protein BH10ACT3_BH10ACT3_01310 [soil metagenome]